MYDLIYHFDVDTDADAVLPFTYSLDGLRNTKVFFYIDKKSIFTKNLKNYDLRRRLRWLLNNR